MRRLTFAVLGAAGLALAACAAPVPVAPSPEARPVAGPAPERPPAETAAQPTPAERAAAILQRERELRRKNPSDLVGLSDREISRLFGQPALLRRDPPAEVWQYAAKRCVLLVFLYPDDETGRQAGSVRVQHAETVNRKPESLGAADCIESLLENRPLPSS